MKEMRAAIIRLRNFYHPSTFEAIKDFIYAVYSIGYRKQ
jgi:hypothetical protein